VNAARLAAILLTFSACAKRGENAPEERRQTMEGLTLSQSEKGQPSWTLKTRRAILREDDKSASLTEPVMEFYKRGAAVSRVTALEGEVDTDSHDVRLSSSVALDSFEDKSRLTTSVLFYHSKRGLFSTPADILVKRPEGVLRGKGLEAKPDLSEIRIFNQSSTLSGTPR
jgi:LPS export ABC transporter protein LptC